MERVLVFLCPLLFLFPLNIYGQTPFFETYQHDLGIKNYMYYFDEGIVDPLTQISFMPVINYNGRFTMVSLGEDAGISAGLNPGINIFVAPQAVGFVFTIPVLIELNLGHQATVNADRDFGTFGGFGFEYNYKNFWDYSPYGPLISAGARGMLFRRSYTIRLTRTHDLGANRGIIHSITINTNL